LQEYFWFEAIVKNAPHLSVSRRTRLIPFTNRDTQKFILRDEARKLAEES
tara:strand:+ start:141 stop:290 length:150 start_codon:yes stop_codon:yes gene_type:complete